MNKVILVGNLVADPEVRTTSAGTNVATLRIAVQRRFANQQGVRESDFFNVICWRQQADFAARYMTKGRKIAVEGSIQNRTYDAQDGTKRYITEIVADSIEFCDSRPNGGSAPRADFDQPVPPPAPQAKPAPGGFTEVEDDDLPF